MLDDWLSATLDGSVAGRPASGRLPGGRYRLHGEGFSNWYRMWPLPMRAAW
ncbi:hypothetical protein [Salinicola acroporae]|uniref:hypothetical protein n=1 Tax=Salinicola acroporae TaxID=1541440 RepID=UPI0031B9B8A5